MTNFVACVSCSNHDADAADISFSQNLFRQCAGPAPAVVLRRQLRTYPLQCRHPGDYVDHLLLGETGRRQERGQQFHGQFHRRFPFRPKEWRGASTSTLKMCDGWPPGPAPYENAIAVFAHRRARGCCPRRWLRGRNTKGFRYWAMDFITFVASFSPSQATLFGPVWSFPTLL